jgi:hypothetical protein
VQIRRDQLKVARVLHEDGDFVTLEVGKRDDVTFNLQQDDTGQTVGGDRFFTILFVRAGEDGASAEVWDPLID